MGTTPLSAVERTEAALDRIARENDRSRIFTHLDEARALAAAKAADRRAQNASGLGPLDGRLVAVKDNIAVGGLPWTAGIGAFRSRIAAADARVVARLRQAGAVILGTLNMHEGALGATTDNPHFGRCQNPLRDGYTPGGSSGGSGAAVAAGLVDIALGSDTMGSVRIPAAYCGVYGLKTTDGAVSRDGLAFLSHSLDTIGPLAASPALLLACHDVMTACDSPVPHMRGVRLAVPSDLARVGCEAAVLDAFARAVAKLRDSGIEIDAVDVGDWEPGRARRGGLLLIEAEAVAAMPEFAAAEVDGVSPSFRACLAYGANLTAPRLVEALARVKHAGDMCRHLLRTYDGLLLPTAPQTAFPFESEAPANQADLTCLANFAACPAIAIPVKTSADALPASIQIIGRPYFEHLLCHIAKLLSYQPDN